jgi:hypothetical protein
VFENRMLKRIFGSRGSEITGGRRKLHIMGFERTEIFSAYEVLMGKPEGKRPLGRSRRRWMDNNKIDLRGIGWDGIS